jgi:hypothetical protein
MNGPLAMIFVIFVIALGFGACWVITAQGSAAEPMQDSFGNTPDPDLTTQSEIGSGLAIGIMPILPMAFMVAVCVVLVIAFLWFWQNGRYKTSKY